MAEDLPALVQKAIAENKRDCKTVALEKGFITRKDINGDGRPDFVLDYEFFICDGNRRGFCGSIGCTTQVFASLPNGAYAKVLDGIFKRIDFREVQGRPAIVVGLPGDAALSKGPDRGLRSRQIMERLGLRGHARPENEWNGRNQEWKIARSDQSGPRGSPRHVRQGPNGPFASDPVMRKHFTAQFISLWDRAMARNDGTIDSDPFTDQGGNSVNLQGVDIIAETPNAATVEMHACGTNPDNSTYPGTQKIWMRREGPSWKIDDIAGLGNMEPPGGVTSKKPSPNSADAQRSHSIRAYPQSLDFERRTFS